MLSENHKYKRFRCLLWLILLSGQCFFVVNANVAVQSLTQSPANPVVEGSTVTYSVTVSNPDADTFVNINIMSNGFGVNGLFTNTAGGCSPDGIFFCGQLINGGVQTYSFTAIANLEGFPSPITFVVNCSGVGCTGESPTVSPITEIIPESVSSGELKFASSPGTTVSATFTVTDSTPTSISAKLGSVDPANLPAGGGEVTYSYDIPSEAVIGEKITDSITISDAVQNESQISVTIIVSPNFGDTPGLTDGEKATAEALYVACDELRLSDSLTEGQENLLDICNQVDSADPATKLSIFQQITPTQVPAQTDLSVQSSNTQLNNVNARMSALRSGASGSSVSGLNLHYAGLTLPAELFFTSQENFNQGLETATEAQSFIPKTGAFITGSVSFGDKEDVADELGFDFNTNGITAGVDYRLSDVQIVGGAVGIVSSDSDFNGSRGNTDIRGLSLLAYSTYYLSQSSYLEAVLSFGKNQFDNSRNIVAGTIDTVASGDTDGTETAISLGAGYDFSQGPYSFSPYGNINYIRADIDGYTEDSNSGLELTYQDQEAESLSTTVGGQLTYAISKDYGVILPTLRFDWTHEFLDDSRFITASFLNDPTHGKFDIKTNVPDRDYFRLGIGASATFSAGRSAFIYYESLLDYDDLSEESVVGGYRWDF